MSPQLSDTEFNISIHVPREGHDEFLCRQRVADGHFNPRAPRGARRSALLSNTVAGTFQSTCPARGTTLGGAVSFSGGRYFNPRAPRGARLFSRIWEAFIIIDFNPRAPRGARHFTEFRVSPDVGFQSTCPARGTTSLPAIFCGVDGISIHVPREGHDLMRRSRAVCIAEFQSTCPARGTT